MDVLLIALMAAFAASIIAGRRKLRGKVIASVPRRDGPLGGATQHARLAIIGVAAAAICFGLFVWPTPYRHVALPPALRTRDNYSCCYVARANRFTGDVEVLGADGWLSWSSLMRDTIMRKAMSDAVTR